MGLLAELEDDPRGRTGTVCGVVAARATLDDDDRADLDAALVTMDPGGIYRYSANRISEAVARRGVDLSEWTIARHRRGGCICGRAS